MVHQGNSQSVTIILKLYSYGVIKIFILEQLNQVSYV